MCASGISINCKYDSRVHQKCFRFEIQLIEFTLVFDCINSNNMPTDNTHSVVCTTPPIPHITSWMDRKYRKSKSFVFRLVRTNTAFCGTFYCIEHNRQSRKVVNSIKYQLKLLLEHCHVNGAME